MAWSNSKVFGFSVLQVGQNVVKYSSDGYMVALYASNTMTPDNTVATLALSSYNGAASQWIVANEVANGLGYTSGGASISPTSWMQSGGTVTFTSSGTPQWTVATFTTYGCLVYDDLVGNAGLSYNYFGGPQEVTAGTFSIAWSASGIASFST